ncbi:hypothetical protein DFP86_10274 [Paludibacterium purpuratum]|uniref:Uncharacterized protein n=1 Tax=Paludibacterium purpuratum TaxID=1144873 RepID=A0A4R7BAM5_9NEIS|nr:hypothetical protein DFP86_10274 [Paludibacterium purpuratum]
MPSCLSNGLSAIVVPIRHVAQEEGVLAPLNP